MKTIILSFFLCCSAIAAPQMGCYDIAVNHRNLSQDVAIALCGGATSNAPITCFDIAGLRNLQLRDKIFLCRGANETTMRCFDLGVSRNLSQSQIIDLCGSTLDR